MAHRLQEAAARKTGHLPTGAAVDRSTRGPVTLPARQRLRCLVLHLVQAAQEALLNYFAMRYHLWQRAVDAGPWVFPFAANRGRSQAQDRENFLSEPYDGPLKALVRGDYKSKWSAGYALRNAPW